MTEAEYLRAIEAIEPALRRAYLEQIRSMVDAVTLAQIERLVAEQDQSGLETALQIGSFAGMLEAIRSAYIAGGRAELLSIPRQQLQSAMEAAVQAAPNYAARLGSFVSPVAPSVPSFPAAPSAAPIPTAPRAAVPLEVRQAAQAAIKRLDFDIRLPSAELFLRENAARLLSEIGESQREAIRVTLAEGNARGQTPRKTALDIIGRVSQQTGRREGGVMGLSGIDAQYVENARTQLLSGDPVVMRDYFNRMRRDKRFDGIVQKAIDAGKPVADKDLDRILGRYADRLLQTRGDMLSKTEALQAYSAGRNQVYQQLIDQGVPANRIRKTWRAKKDERTRESHREMDGQTVQYLQSFVSPRGARLNYPGDTSQGAGWSEVAGCRCRSEFRLMGNA